MIGVVGPCAAGKSTLIAKLKERGYQARHIAQEHSHVPDMWKRVSNPDCLIFLDVSYPVSMQRKKMNWNENEFLIQVRRLQHARQHADLYIQTDQRTPGEVQQMVFVFLEKNE